MLLVHSAEVVRQSGFLPVPHLVARNIQSRDQLCSLLTDLSLAGATEEVLVLGGSLGTPQGPYASASDLLTALHEELHGAAPPCPSATRSVSHSCSRPLGHSTIFRKAPLGRVYLAAHPSGHPALATHTLATQILAEKVRIASQLINELQVDWGTDPSASINAERESQTNAGTVSSRPTLHTVAAITQLCFDFADIEFTLRSLSAHLPPACTLPVFVGVLPPVSPARVAELVTKLALAPASVTLPQSPTAAQFFRRDAFLNSALAAVRAGRAEVGRDPGDASGGVGRAEVGRDPGDASGGGGRAEVGRDPGDASGGVGGRAVVAGLHVYGLAAVKTVLDTAARIAGRLSGHE
jgi:hypothetical protein